MAPYTYLVEVPAVMGEHSVAWAPQGAFLVRQEGQHHSLVAEEGILVAEADILAVADIQVAVHQGGQSPLAALHPQADL